MLLSTGYRRSHAAYSQSHRQNEMNNGASAILWHGKGMVWISENVASLQRRNSRKLYSILGREKISQSTVDHYTSILFKVKKTLRSSERDWIVFDAGFNELKAPASTLPNLEDIFGSEKLVSIPSGHGSRGSSFIPSPIFCFTNALQIVNWVSRNPNSIALVLASSMVHVYLILTAVHLNLEPPKDPDRQIAEAHNFFEQLWLDSVEMQSILSQAQLSLKKMKFSSKYLKRVFSSIQPFESLDSSTSSLSTSRSRSKSFESSGARPEKPMFLRDSREEEAIFGPLRRTVSTIGELQKFTPCCQKENCCWRKMILRKLSVSQVSILQENKGRQCICNNSASKSGNQTEKYQQNRYDYSAKRNEGRKLENVLHPFAMVLNCDESEIVASTMTAGLKEMKFDINNSIELDLNCLVEKDVILKVYDLEPGKSAKLMIRAHLNMPVLEPMESLAMLEQYPDGEQSILVCLSSDSIDFVSDFNLNGMSLFVFLLFGMPSRERAQNPNGPGPIEMDEQERPDGSPFAVEGSNLSLMGAGSPPIQFKCINPFCCRIQYLDPANYDHQTACCENCDTLMPLPGFLTRIKQETRLTSLKENIISEAEEEKETMDQFEALRLDPFETLPSSSNENRFLQAIDYGTERRVSDSSGPDALMISEPVQNISTTPERSNDSDFDINAIITSRIDYLMSVATYLDRELLSQYLHARFADCSSSEEIDWEVQNLATLLVADAVSPETFIGGTIHKTALNERPGQIPPVQFASAILALWECRYMSRSGATGRLPLFSSSPSILRSRRNQTRSLGIPLHEMSSFPTHQYTMPGDGSKQKCPICISEYNEGSQVRTLPCFHMYHVECIDSWLMDSTRCPVCLWKVC